MRCADNANPSDTLQYAKFHFFDKIEKLFKIKSIKFNWRYKPRKTKPFAVVFNFLANISPKVCERFWCYLVGGFEEFTVEMVRK